MLRARRCILAQPLIRPERSPRFAATLEIKARVGEDDPSPSGPSKCFLSNMQGECMNMRVKGKWGLCGEYLSAIG